MSAVTTLAVTVAAAAAGVALYRLVDRRTRPIRSALKEWRGSAGGAASSTVIDYERDPESGVFRPKDGAIR